jgi:hypothetical protein
MEFKVKLGNDFKSYLFGRKQKEEMESPNYNYNTYSNWAIVKHGVPQGSILGPLLAMVCGQHAPLTPTWVLLMRDLKAKIYRSNS